MSVWIKICANTTVEDAQLAAELGAEAVGFVFAPSKRRVTVEQVAAIVPNLPREIEKIGVFVDVSFNEIAEAVESSGLTGVQLHFQAPALLIAQLRDHFGSTLRIVRTVHVSANDSAGMSTQEAGALACGGCFSDPNIDAILVDSKTATGKGGTGQAYDWDLAASNLFQYTKERKLIAAGGLRPNNIAAAIRILNPWGVDVASGVEAGPGRKDAAKLRDFIANARAIVLK
jgi:phosphoribosylanthranilate isomerase